MKKCYIVDGLNGAKWAFCKKFYLQILIDIIMCPVHEFSKFKLEICKNIAYVETTKLINLLCLNKYKIINIINKIYSIYYIRISRIKIVIS
jgi:hypothetical protein